jgi:hypothetical protein
LWLTLACNNSKGLWKEVINMSIAREDNACGKMDHNDIQAFSDPEIWLKVQQWQVTNP